MNNYHLFLIRSDQATQIIGHLVAGIITLAFIFSLAGTDPVPAPEGQAANLAVPAVSIPAGTEMIAASK